MERKRVLTGDRPTGKLHLPVGRRRGGETQGDGHGHGISNL